MTVDELATILKTSAKMVPEADDVPDDLNRFLDQMAAWIQISEPGFDYSDAQAMVKRCEVLIGILVHARSKLRNYAGTVTDDDDEDDDE
jgi:hypothetical protein